MSEERESLGCEMIVLILKRKTSRLKKKRFLELFEVKQSNSKAEKIGQIYNSAGR